MRDQTTDLTPRMPFTIDPSWYERHWYGDRPPSRASRVTQAFHKTWIEGRAIAKLIPVTIGRAIRSLSQLTTAH